MPVAISEATMGSQAQKQTKKLKAEARAKAGQALGINLGAREQDFQAELSSEDFSDCGAEPAGNPEGEVESEEMEMSMRREETQTSNSGVEVDEAELEDEQLLKKMELKMLKLQLLKIRHVNLARYKVIAEDGSSILDLPEHSLSDILREKGSDACCASWAVSILRQICRAAFFLHTRGFAYGNITAGMVGWDSNSSTVKLGCIHRLPQPYTEELALGDIRSIGNLALQLLSCTPPALNGKGFKQARSPAQSAEQAETDPKLPLGQSFSALAFIAECFMTSESAAAAAHSLLTHTFFLSQDAPRSCKQGLCGTFPGHCLSAESARSPQKCSSDDDSSDFSDSEDSDDSDDEELGFDDIPIIVEELRVQAPSRRPMQVPALKGPKAVMFQQPSQTHRDMVEQDRLKEKEEQAARFSKGKQTTERSTCNMGIKGGESQKKPVNRSPKKEQNICVKRVKGSSAE